MIRHLLLTVLVASILPASAFAYGEGDGGRPSVEERALHLWTDAVRVDPDYTDVQFDEYDPVPPLVYDSDLNDAARFYAEDMYENGCFPADHSSCDGTPFDQRLWSFYDGNQIGENIAMGALTPRAAVFNAWLYSDGHRENMLHGSFEELGTGFAGSPFSDTRWVQDFGARGATPIPVVTSATHAPLWPDPGEAVDIYASVHDEAGLPASVDLMVDGLCYEMEPERGGGSSRIFQARVQAGTQACVPYVISVTRIGGERVTFPDEGSLLFAVDEAECDAWSPQRSASECAPASGGGSGLGGEGIGCGGSGGDPNDNVGEDVDYGSCSLSPAPQRLGALLGLALFVGAARRRR